MKASMNEYREQTSKHETVKYHFTKIHSIPYEPAS